ncbi:MAG TPA: hypothetical protein VMU19_05915 [Bryobacteraceae bacterium]|nr:hypothetical protein [Bryobacteraceae bacterium]
MFQPSAYGADVARILSLDGAGSRPMPLAGGLCSSARALAEIGKSTPSKLFPHSRAPEAAMAGLYVYYSCWNQAHETAQDIATPDGSYWHAIVHRQEPDASNSAYRFRQTGRHAIFPALLEAAAAEGMTTGSQWHPFAFLDYCERARGQKGSEGERIALAVQLAEWQLLFDYCAASK